MEHGMITGCRHSTPGSNTRAKLPNLSISQIDSGSSAGSKETVEPKLSSPVLAGKRIKKAKKIPVRKKLLQPRSKDHRKATDSEWETDTENSIRTSDNKDVTNVQTEIQTPISDVSSTRINLFEDERSPETVRDVPIEYKRLLNDSPIITSSRFRAKQSERTREKDIQIAQQDELLPISLPPAETQRDNPETSDEELIFHHQNNLRTYLGPARQPKPNRYVMDFLYPGTFSLPSLSDILWDQFIAKHQDERIQNSASAQARVPSTSASLPVVSPKSNNTLIAQDMARERGYRNETLHKRKRHVNWNDSDYKDTNHIFKNRRLANCKTETRIKRKVKTRAKDMAAKRKEKTTPFQYAQREEISDVYILDESDVEFETGGANGKRMIFAEFRHYQMMKKISSTNSHSGVKKV